MVFVNVYGETFEDMDRNVKVERNDNLVKDMIHSVRCFESSFINMNSELIAIQNRLEESIYTDVGKLKRLIGNINRDIDSYQGGK